MSVFLKYSKIYKRYYIILSKHELEKELHIYILS